jgi:hypothetical protein
MRAVSLQQSGGRGYPPGSIVGECTFRPVERLKYSGLWIEIGIPLPATLESKGVSRARLWRVQ